MLQKFVLQNGDIYFGKILIKLMDFCEIFVALCKYLLHSNCILCCEFIKLHNRIVEFVINRSKELPVTKMANLV